LVSLKSLLRQIIKATERPEIAAKAPPWSESQTARREGQTAFCKGNEHFPDLNLGKKWVILVRTSCGKRSPMTKVPTYEQLMNPLITALADLGGSGSIDEIYEKVIENLKLPEDVLSILHDPKVSNNTEIHYRLAWARTYLKKYGFLDNSSRGVWALTKAGKASVDPKEVIRVVREQDRKEKEAKPGQKNDQTTLQAEAPEEVQDWRKKLYTILTKSIDPAAFERLIQRLLRESGFVQVEVTGRTGDGGIDGKGIARIHGFMSFHVVFQCKRYQGIVSASHIRDFRGAMVGRADKGLFITTGTFSRDAVKEATRDGAPPIDLVDGDQLAEKLKQFNLGISTEMKEEVTVNESWFTTI
jgi:restriction system protein